MFVIQKLKNCKPLKIIKKNNRFSLESETEFYIQYATEKYSRDKLLVGETDTEGCIDNLKNVKVCKFFDLSTRMKESSAKESKPLTYNELQILHGSKRSQKQVKTKEQIENQLNIDQISFSNHIGEEQVLPNFDENAQAIKDIYRLNIMFDNRLLQQIRDYEFESSNLRVESFTYNETQKVPFIVLDTILYILRRKYIPDRLPHGNISYDILTAIISQKDESQFLEYNKVKNYNSHEKLKFITMALIMILRIKRYKISITELPNFHIPDTDVLKILKLLGCKVDGGTATLLKIPESKVVTKRRARRN